MHLSSCDMASQLIVKHRSAGGIGALSDRGRKRKRLGKWPGDSRHWGSSRHIYFHPMCAPRRPAEIFAMSSSTRSKDPPHRSVLPGAERPCSSASWKDKESAIVFLFGGGPRPQLNDVIATALGSNQLTSLRRPASPWSR